MHSHKVLHLPKAHISLQDILNKELGISKILAQLLINRGINNVKEAEKFLNAKLEHLLDPYTFSQMSKAVQLIKEASQKKHKIMVCGDYDVDGLTSVALLKDTLRHLGQDVMHYLPHRINDGYGLNKKILQIATHNKVKLIITADCGMNDHEHIQELKDNNIEVIVTDHHESMHRDGPPASAVINPKSKDSSYKYRDLAGVGVVYKLCQAITGRLLSENLDLVSLGTVADVVPLTGENRVMVKEGLAMMSRTKRPGLKALIRISGIKDKEINAHFVSYILGPRINASGRMDTAETSLSLLMSESEEEAERLAKMVDAYNRQRQKIEGKVLEEAESIIAREINFKEHKVIVVAGEDWHQGVLGIVASKLTDRFHRPTIVISKAGDLCKGSGRSIKSFHLFQALLECKDVLEQFGGHSHAVGLLINKNRISDFKDKINLLAKERLKLEDLLPSIEVDMELSLSDLDEELIAQLDLLEPFGTDNPRPLFYTRQLRLKAEPLILGKNTLKFWVTDGNITYQAIGFGMSDFKDSLIQAKGFDLVYTPRIDTWGGSDTVLLEVEDIFFK